MHLIDILTRLDGRIGRLRFWLGMVVLFAITTAIGLAVVKMLGIDAFQGPYSGSSAFSLAFGLLALLLWIPVMLKRLHDLNVSGRWLWPIVALESIRVAGDLLGYTGTAIAANPLGTYLSLASGIYAVVLMIMLGFVRGTRGPNDFGPDPREAAPDPANL